MWDNARFVVRRFFLDLGGNLGSWRLSVVLMVWAAFYYLLLAIWARASPAQVVQNIASLLPFWIVYGLLLVNTGVCLWRRLPQLRRDLDAKPRLTERPAEWQERVPAGSVEEARALLAALGYRGAGEREGRVAGVRRRWAPLGTFVFHGAFFLLATGFLLTLLARQEATVWVAVGEDFEGRPDQFMSQSQPRPFAAGVPTPRFRVETIRPEFWGNQLLFTTLEADLVLDGAERATTRINRPLWLGYATFLRLSGFGYAPHYELTDRAGLVLDGAIVKLNVFPPGQRDYFMPLNYPHRLYVELFPDFALRGGQPFSRSLNLARPAVGVQVYRGQLELARGVLPQGEGIGFEGLTLRFPEIRYWGAFSIVFDPGAPIVFAGFGVGLLGLLLKIRGGRAEAEWAPDPESGGGVLRGWGEPTPRSLAGIAMAGAESKDGSGGAA